ncbi:hypothetical protein [Nocardioides sp. T2.26MG-1]|uniref:hypothetical protein n=1 Tax=Nocardioides sp. T2.26MG-1 TaxID=3041166 RepID=UPI002477A85C|nr:hypothetical protein [Nocardioides sp. T2.26MG-1]CAI9403106.1 hypothetical protein HIDPHFAB_00952 [Nocardioides sp. T2.26MG-1]
MPDKQQTLIASNEDLRKMLALLHSTFAYGSSVVAATLALGWAYAAIKDDVSVPTLLPILTIASVLFTVVAWVTQEEIRQIGLPYRTKVE